MGLKMAVPSTEMTKALLGEHMLSVGAGDNVVRLLPPLIIDSDVVSDAIGRIDRACGRLEAEMGLAPSNGAVA